MHPDGHVDSSQSIDKDQMMDIKRRFFFTRDVAKSKRFIVNQTDAN